MNGFPRVLTILTYSFLGAFVAVVFTILIMIAVVVPTVPRVPAELSELISVPPTEVFAADGSIIAQVGGRSSIPIERVAPVFRQAVLAVEDDQFYSHAGIDKPALIRATVSAIFGNDARGGSTISQQLAKNLFFSFEKSWSRKFKEILAAFEIERRFSKDDILEAYINGIPFGNFAYGVEEAARVYFGKHASELTLAEATLLAGLPQSPSRYNPYRNPELARERQSWVLYRMFSLGWITQTEYQRALNTTLHYRPLYDHADEGSYFLDAVLDELEERYGQTVLYHGGLKIYTTMDPLLQRYAVESVQEGLAMLDERMGLPEWNAAKRDSVDRPQGALVSVEAATGAVRALVGGRDWVQSQFNRTIQSSRNMGSVLKPVLYLTAIEQAGITPASMVSDSSVTITIPGSRPWTPRNFTPRFYGVMPLKVALMRSLNTVAAKLVMTIDADAMVESLYRFNVHSEQTPNPAIALGATSVNAIELAGIGAGIANLGQAVDPYLVTRVEDLHGRVLEEQIVRRNPAFDADDVYLLIDMMQGVIEGGTGRSVRRMGFDLPAIGKTGTTNDYRDSWFLGATPRLATCAWVGYDDNRPMRAASGAGITGTTGALPVWTVFMKRATEGDPPREFRVPTGVRTVKIHPATGELMEPDEPGGIRLAVHEDTELPDYRLLMLDRIEDWDNLDRVMAEWDQYVGMPWAESPFYVPPWDSVRARWGGFTPQDAFDSLLYEDPMDSIPSVEDLESRGGRR
ncbi:PBP1A family penicillin-binding protein [bacterium]|nr:PBP1A family penicillin-binding protein [bacterium]